MCLQSFFLCWTWIWLSIESDNGCCCKSWLHPQKKPTKIMVCWDCFTKTIHICWCRLLIERNMGSNSLSILKTSNKMWRKQQLEALLLMYFKLLKSIQISCVIGFKGEDLFLLDTTIVGCCDILIRVSSCNCYYYVQCSMYIMLYCFQ